MLFIGLIALQSASSNVNCLLSDTLVDWIEWAAVQNAEVKSIHLMLINYTTLP